MKTNRVPCRRAFTKVELLAVLTILFLLILMLGIPAVISAKAKANRISCVSHLANIGLAFRIFATDNDGLFPFQISTNETVATNHPPVSESGGTREFAQDAASAWRHFAAISNELSTPLILRCPNDKERTAARRFSEFTNNRFLSYTLGLSASEEQPQSILSSDRNLLLDGTPLTNSFVRFRTNANLAWDRRIHKFAGNVLLGDGSVQQFTAGWLSAQFRDAFPAMGTNVLVIP